MDTIEGMRVFVAVAKHQSFTGGARRLGVSTKLASNHVKQLEERLKAQLFNRTTRSVNLTETGHAYLERCLPLLDQFDELEGLVHANQSELAGSIRVTAPTGFGSRELVDALCPFQLEHPKVTIELNLSDQRVSVVEEGFDLAIRIGALVDSSLMARKLKDMRLVVFASPEYLARCGVPAQPSDLASHQCLLSRTSIDPEHWRFRQGNTTQSVRVDGPFRANSPRAITQMAAGGLGIGKGPIYAAESFIKSGRLRLLFEDVETTGAAIYAVYPPNRHLTARIRALIDHLVRQFADEHREPANHTLSN